MFQKVMEGDAGFFEGLSCRTLMIWMLSNFWSRTKWTQTDFSLRSFLLLVHDRTECFDSKLPLHHLILKGSEWLRRLFAFSKLESSLLL